MIPVRKSCTHTYWVHTISMFLYWHVLVHTWYVLAWTFSKGFVQGVRIPDVESESARDSPTRSDRRIIVPLSWQPGSHLLLEPCRPLISKVGPSISLYNLGIWCFILAIYLCIPIIRKSLSEQWFIKFRLRKTMQCVWDVPPIRSKHPRLPQR